MLKDPDNHLESIHPTLRTFAHFVAGFLQPHGLHYRITDGARLKSEQRAEWAKGREISSGVGVSAEKPLGITVTEADGETKLSPHQFGDAFDGYAMIPLTGVWVTDGHPMAAAAWKLIKAAGEAFARAYPDAPKLEWGGDWRGGWDKPHWQLAEWETVRDSWKSATVAEASAPSATLKKAEAGFTGGIAAAIIGAVGVGTAVAVAIAIIRGSK